MYFQHPPAVPIHRRLGDYNNIITTVNGTALTMLSNPMMSERSDIFLGGGDTEIFFPFIPTPLLPGMDRNLLEMRDSNLSTEHDIFKALTMLSNPMMSERSDIFLGGGDTEIFFPFIPTPLLPGMDRNLLEMRDSNLSTEHDIFKGLLATVTTYHRNTEQPDLPVKPVLPSIDFLISPNKIKCSTDVKQQEKDSNQRMKRHKRGQGTHLWEFVRDLLLNPVENREILQWEDRREGIFRVIKSNAFAQLWGKEKKNIRMNYEKLSRALRHYYKTGILERVDGRLRYKFGERASGWKESWYL